MISHLWSAWHDVFKTKLYRSLHYARWWLADDRLDPLDSINTSYCDYESRFYNRKEYFLQPNITITLLQNFVSNWILKYKHKMIFAYDYGNFELKIMFATGDYWTLRLRICGLDWIDHLLLTPSVTKFYWIIWDRFGESVIMIDWIKSLRQKACNYCVPKVRFSEKILFIFHPVQYTLLQLLTSSRDQTSIFLIGMGPVFL